MTRTLLTRVAIAGLAVVALGVITLFVEVAATYGEGFMSLCGSAASPFPADAECSDLLARRRLLAVVVIVVGALATAVALLLRSDLSRSDLSRSDLPVTPPAP
ncbi:hypothetical protein [Actinotalea sp. K2]|uniref:hypothetical protein n=1 Tax=Actinotalea sp. K2 TaxID=2939438 RepID=UPI002017500C|nr:hypothetical protein [Actinotalea sp. K2]MCL3861573.1 hypothetical protein [Actinotalea sp. K2]